MQMKPKMLYLSWQGEKETSMWDQSLPETHNSLQILINWEFAGNRHILRKMSEHGTFIMNTAQTFSRYYWSM